MIFSIDSTDSVYFSEPLGDVTAKENDNSAIFECRLSSVIPDVVWRHRASNDKPEKDLKNGEKHQIVSDGTRHYLRVCDLTSLDAGEYSCVVDYEGADEIRTSAQLLVTGKNDTV